MLKNKFTKHLFSRSKEKTFNKRVLFLHIPKTAGTSLRKALEKKYHVISDYGSSNKETHALILEHICNKSDFYGLCKALEGSSFCLSGHYSINKYLDMVDIGETITFVRQPLEQVVSHFNHFKKHFTEQKAIEEFILQPRFINSQFKMLQPIPIGLIGYVGITEDYNESVKMINQVLGLDIIPLVENVNDQKHTIAETFSDSFRRQLLSINSYDCDLYDEAVWLHRLRKEFAESSKQWTHAYVKVTQQNVLLGAAYRKGCDLPVKLQVMANNEVVKEVEANEYMPEFPKANLPRNRYIRFHLPLNKLVDNSANLDVFIADTNQKINFKPLVLNT